MLLVLIIFNIILILGTYTLCAYSKLIRLISIMIIEFVLPLFVHIDIPS